MKKHRQIVVIAHDMRSIHNVGSLLRTAEGLGVHHVTFTGYTPYPQLDNDPRLPHIARKVHQQIQKTALGAELTQSWSHEPDLTAYLEGLRDTAYTIYALEQTKDAYQLPDFEPPQKLAIILGREVEGVSSDILAICDGSLEIPMIGQKESLNVVQAAAMLLYHCTFYP